MKTIGRSEDTLGSTHQSGYAPKTVDHIHDVLSAILRTAVRNGAASRRALRVAWICRRSVRAAEVGADDKPGSCAAVRAGAASTHDGRPLRRGEIFALRWEDIDEQKAAAHGARSRLRLDVQSPKTEAGLRQVPLSAFARQLIGE